MKNQLQKSIITAVILVWGFASMIYLAGEPVDESMEFATFIFYKLIGFGSLLGSIFVGGFCYKNGYMMTFEEDDYEF